MENSNSFNYQYSAKTNKEVENIRKRYLPAEETKLERLQRLDRKVREAGVIPSLCVGIVGALLFGVGMCFGLGALTGPAFLKFIFGITGTVVMLPAYPLFKYMSKMAKEKLSPEIIRLSDELMAEGK
ncbi:MAG: hypothetical protein IJW66_05215 [Clostridia bacterium]|nr:hypothetical protein [Clostridia bacterium]